MATGEKIPDDINSLPDPASFVAPEDGYKRKRKKKREPDEGGPLNINSLMDIMTILLVFLFSLRNFAIGSTYARTEALLTAIVGALVFHEALAGAGWLAVAMGAMGVVIINLARTGAGAGIAGDTLLRRLFQPAAGVGLLAGLGFAGASLFLRQASLSLGLDDWLYAAALTLAMVLVIQTAIMSAYILLRARDQL